MCVFVIKRYYILMITIVRLRYLISLYLPHTWKINLYTYLNNKVKCQCKQFIDLML